MNIHKHITTYHAKLMSYLPQLITSIVVFLLFWIAAIIVKRIIIRLANHSKHRKYLLKLLGQTAKAFIVMMGLISALGTLGINVMALVTSLGLVGFAIGFALKDSLSNTIAGFMILFYHPFQVNDYIALSNIEGIIVDINLRYTTVNNGDKTHMIPNSNVLSNIVTITTKEHLPHHEKS